MVEGGCRGQGKWIQRQACVGRGKQEAHKALAECSGTDKGRGKGICKRYGRGVTGEK